MKFSPRLIGLLQAVGVIVYITLFAFAAHNFQQWATTPSPKLNPIAAIIVFLLAFIISALICGSIVLAYPILTFFGESKLIAVKIVGWTLAWLVIVFVLFFFGSLIFFLKP